MKYVLLKKPGEMPRIRLGFSPETHKEIAAPLIAAGFDAKSAGFVRFNSDGSAETFGMSESLNLHPFPSDAVFITAFHKVTKEQAS